MSGEASTVYNPRASRVLITTFERAAASISFRKFVLASRRQKSRRHQNDDSLPRHYAHPADNFAEPLKRVLSLHVPGGKHPLRRRFEPRTELGEESPIVLKLADKRVILRHRERLHVLFVINRICLVMLVSSDIPPLQWSCRL